MRLPINWALLRHPINWIIVLLMILIAGFVLDLVAMYVKQLSLGNGE